MQNSFSFICETVVSAESPFLELQKCLPAATSLHGGKSMEMMENQCVFSDVSPFRSHLALILDIQALIRSY
ncbi:hypothetical protein D5086_014039 [Populus alba]|uniref:Uncharacterized protein n=1 Tax=Populus alba TaxID=43335 RepID=A0ACC4C800_POPAL